MNAAPYAYVIPGLPPQKIDPDFVLKRVCGYYNIDTQEILQKGRKEPLVHIRQIAIYLLSEYLGMGPTAIARLFKMDHSTAIYSKRFVAGQMESKFDNMFKEDVPKIQNYLTVKY